MRILLASAGLLVLAGAAVAGRPTAYTLRRSPGGPIVAVAQNNSVGAWFTSGAKAKTCNVVHIMSPGKRDRSLPLPSPATQTCSWTLAGTQPQLAVASKISTALWTLHESGPQPADRVIAASVGGPERQLRRLAHAQDGTGQWLEDVAGGGRTLAYSWADVEYVDPSGCLSGGSCKQKIADGGIRLVSRTDVTNLPGAGAALQIATAGGRIAYVPATTVKSGRPSVTLGNTLRIVDAVTGAQLGQAFVRGLPIAIGLTPRVLAVLTTSEGPRDRITWFSAADGTKLGNALVSPGAAPQLAVGDRLIVYRVGRYLRDVSIRTGHPGKLVKTGLTSIGLSLAKNRLLWADNHNGSGRLRALSVG